MRFRIGCVDGNTYESREFTHEELQKVLDDANGYIGTGFNKNVKVETVEEAIKLIIDSCEYDSSFKSQTFTIETYSGSMRTFNVRHIIWWELVE